MSGPEAPASLWQLVEYRAAASPQRLLAVDERSRRITFAQLRTEAERVAAAFHLRGIRADDVVSWQLPTSIEAMVLAAALSRLGAIQNPIVPINRDREIGFVVRQLKTRLLVVRRSWRGYDYAAMADRVAGQVADESPERHDELAVLVVDTQLPRADPAVLPAWQAPSPGEVASVRWVLFTSGTTAAPKGAQHTDTTLLTSCRGMVERMHMGPEDRFGIAFPFTHIGGLTLLFANLLVGSSSILLETFNAEGIEAFAREGVTLAGAGTVFNLAYLKRQAQQPDTPLFPHVRAFPGGGAPKPPDLHERMKEEFGGAGIISGFGTTETGFLTMTDVDDPDEKLAATEGRAYPECELTIRRPDGSCAEPGEEGEICARGPMVMRGYSDPALDKAFDAAGLFHTGDLGSLDHQGYLRVTGRLKDVIIRKGENISAGEVEQLIRDHPAVADCAVIGQPDPETGERCVAVIVTTDGAVAPSVREMGDYLRARGLAVFKIPEQLEAIEELPRNAGGKVSKHLLKAKYQYYQGIEAPPLTRMV